VYQLVNKNFDNIKMHGTTVGEGEHAPLFSTHICNL